MAQRCSPEDYAIALARHFVNTYPLVRRLARMPVHTACAWKGLRALQRGSALAPPPYLL